MPWNLLILPLAGGYYIITRCNFYKFKQQRLDKQRLIFDSILIGITIIAITFFIRKATEAIAPSWILEMSKFLPVQLPYIGTTIFSFLFSVIFTEVGNVTFWRSKRTQIERAIKQVGNELELLLKSSFNDSKLLQFTLDTDKFYIAWVKELPIPTVSNYIRVIPVFSGYRDDQKRLVFTTHYLTVYSDYVNEGRVENIEELDVDLVLTLDNLVSVSYFDVEMFERFNNPREE